jgi:hypothetical protein
MELKYKTKDKLPDTPILTSLPVLFIIDGKRYAGHYHANGFFYVAEYQRYKDKMFYGGTKESEINFGVQAIQKCTSWEYVELEE